MSTEALGAASGVPAGELALTQRVRQLQALIEESREINVEGLMPNSSEITTTGASTAAAGIPAGSASPGGAPGQTSTSFAAALQAATTADMAPGGATGAEGNPTLSATESTSQYDPLIEQAAARYGIDPAVLHGLIQQESGFDPEAQSSAGAAGLTQLMPGTASSLGVSNPLNPAESIEGGARYLSQMMSKFDGNTEDALAAYNAGPGAVQQYGGVPPYAETQSYVQKVLGYAQAYRQARGTSLGVTA